MKFIQIRRNYGNPAEKGVDSKDVSQLTSILVQFFSLICLRNFKIILNILLQGKVRGGFSAYSCGHKLKADSRQLQEQNLALYLVAQQMLQTRMWY